MANIKAIIFDLNGVFIQSPKLSERFERDFDVPIDQFLPALKEIMRFTYLPEANDTYSYWKPYLDKWKASLNQEEFYDYWFSAEKEVPELIEFAKGQQKEGKKIIILSNNFKERSKYYEKNFQFLNNFDGLYFSWQTGYLKPNPKAYEKILEDHNLKPEECIYFDDSEENIKIAQSLGITAYPFIDLEDTKEKLEYEKFVK